MSIRYNRREWDIINRMLEIVWCVGIFYVLIWMAVMANDVDYEGVEVVYGSADRYVEMERR